MNVIVSNRYSMMLQELNIDIIKSLNGEFDVEEIISTFQNFYFQRMILDVTALKNYKDIKTLQKLSVALDMSKVILLLDDSLETASNEYLSNLISMGIYNFTKNNEGIMYLYNNPNSYRDVAHIHQLNNNPTDNSGNTSTGNQKVIEPTIKEPHKVRIIGVKNVTEHAGATTLIYMMKKQLEKNYRVVGMEVDRRDFMYFKDQDLISTTSSDLNATLTKYNDCDVILLDLNTAKEAEKVCTDVLYLLEPSTIKLNKLMLVNSRILGILRDKKVILNKSILSSKDVLDFEYESGLKVFYNIPPLDERDKNIATLNKFLVRIGFNKQQDKDGQKNKILGIFG